MTARLATWLLHRLGLKAPTPAVLDAIDQLLTQDDPTRP